MSSQEIASYPPLALSIRTKHVDVDIFSVLNVVSGIIWGYLIPYANS